MIRTILAISAFTLFMSQSFATALAYVVTKDKLIAKTINNKVLKQVLTGKKVYWDSGARIKVCHLNTSSKEFKRFLAKNLNMSSDQYLNLWRRKLFTGRGLPPKQVNSEELVIACVKKSPSSIGIIFSSVETDLQLIKL